MCAYQTYLENPKGKDQAMWCNFLRESNGRTAMCKLCSRVLSTLGGSTSSLRKHLRFKHKELSDRRTETEPTTPPKKMIKVEHLHISPVIAEPVSRKKAPITPKSAPKVLTPKRIKELPLSETLSQVLARMAALDGFPIISLATSSDIRQGLTARGFWDVPTTPESCWQMIMTYFNKVKQTMISDFHKLKEQGIRFAVSLEELSSTRKRRYINVNLRNRINTWNLGVIRMVGESPEVQIAQLLAAKLCDFGIFLEPDVVAVTADSTMLMQKIQQMLPVNQQTCMAYKIQSAIVNVLYSSIDDPCATNQFSTDSPHFHHINIPEAEIDETEDDEDTSFHMFSVDHKTAPKLDTSHYELGPLIHKVREVIKIFQRPHTPNESVLQRYILQSFGMEIPVRLDCMSRWSSTCEMLETFYKVRTSIKKALEVLQVDIDFSDFEYKCIENTTAALLPVKMAIEVLCRSDANLITADAALQFMFDRLAEVNGELSEQLVSLLTECVEQCRTEASSVLQFLHGQSQNSSFKFKVAGKNDTSNIVCSLLRRLNAQNEDTTDEFISQISQSYESDTEQDYEKLIQDSNSTLQEQLDKAIMSAVTPKYNKTKCSKDVEGSVRREIEIFLSHNVRGEYLEKCYRHLLTIQPASLRLERAFLNTNTVCPQIRCPSANDEIVDVMCYLRAHFQQL